MEHYAVLSMLLVLNVLFIGAVGLLSPRGRPEFREDVVGNSFHRYE